MDRQKSAPSLTKKITRKLTQESSEHNNEMNFYSSISRDETGAPKRWTMSSSVDIGKESLAGIKAGVTTGKSGATNSSRENSGERRGGTTSSARENSWERRGGANSSARENSGERRSGANSSTRENSGERRSGANRSVRENSGERRSRSLSNRTINSQRKSKEDGIADQAHSREYSRESREKTKQTDIPSRKSLPSLTRNKDKVSDDRSKVTVETNCDTLVKRKPGRPRSLDLSTKGMTNGEDERFKCPVPLTPCNVIVKRRKGRPKETPPTLVAESPVAEAAELDVGNNTDPEVDASISENDEDTTQKSSLPRRGKLKPIIKVKRLSRSDTMKLEPDDNKIRLSSSNCSEVHKRKRGRPFGAKNRKRPNYNRYKSRSTCNVQKAGANKIVKTKVNVISKLKARRMKTLPETATADVKSEVVENDQASVLSDEKMEETFRSVLNKSFDELVSGKFYNKKDSLRHDFLKRRGRSLAKNKKQDSMLGLGIKKKRMLISQTVSSNTIDTIAHLAVNDLRRKLNSKLIEKLNGKRLKKDDETHSVSEAANKTAPEVEMNSNIKLENGIVTEENEDVVEHTVSKSMESDMQNLSALIEQKRVNKTETDYSEKRHPGQKRRLSVDQKELSKYSDNDSVCSDHSSISLNSLKKPFEKQVLILGEEQTDSDQDTVRTRQRFEIIPGKKRKRTLSGEFDLVDEHQLRMKKKMSEKQKSDGEEALNKNVVDDIDDVTIESRKKKLVKRSPKSKRVPVTVEESESSISTRRPIFIRQSPFLHSIKKKRKRLWNQTNRISADIKKRKQENLLNGANSDADEADGEVEEESTVSEIVSNSNREEESLLVETSSNEVVCKDNNVEKDEDSIKEQTELDIACDQDEVEEADVKVENLASELDTENRTTELEEETECEDNAENTQTESNDIIKEEIEDTDIPSESEKDEIENSEVEHDENIDISSESVKTEIESSECLADNENIAITSESVSEELDNHRTTSDSTVTQEQNIELEVNGLLLEICDNVEKQENNVDENINEIDIDDKSDPTPALGTSSIDEIEKEISSPPLKDALEENECPEKQEIDSSIDINRDQPEELNLSGLSESDNKNDIVTKSDFEETEAQNDFTIVKVSNEETNATLEEKTIESCDQPLATPDMNDATEIGKVDKLDQKVERIDQKVEKKPTKSSPIKDSPESGTPKKMELRQKISRSPLDNIALKQSIEESEYYRNEAKKAEKKEAKLKLKKTPPRVVDTIVQVTAPVTEPSFDLSENDINSSTEELVETPKRTIESLLSECKPCSVTLIDFIKQLQRTRTNADDDSDSGLKEGVEQDSGSSPPEAMESENREVPQELTCVPETENTSAHDAEQKEVNNDSDRVSSVSESEVKMVSESTSTPESNSVVEGNDVSDRVNTIPVNPKVISPKREEKASISATYPSEQQTARKTVPPLKIKLKGGLSSRKKTYMVESIEQLTTKVEKKKAKGKSGNKVVSEKKKSKSKSGSKSGSDSDKSGKHHHHHKRRSKTTTEVIPEVVDAPTVETTSESMLQTHVPKDAFEANFLQFIQNKDKDKLPFIQTKDKAKKANSPRPTPPNLGLHSTSISTKGKALRQLPDGKGYKVDEDGSLTVTAACPSETATSTTNNDRVQTCVSVSSSNTESPISSISSQPITSVVGSSQMRTNNSDTDKQNIFTSVFGASIMQTNSSGNEKENVSADIGNRKSDTVTKPAETKVHVELFIGVKGTRENMHYFCSHCQSIDSKSDDDIVEHFREVHPSAPIQYRRVANTYQRETQAIRKVDDVDLELMDKEDAEMLEMTMGTQQEEPVTLPVAGMEEEGLVADSKDASGECASVKDDSDSGSLQLKIVDVYSLKDQVDSEIAATSHENDTSNNDSTKVSAQGSELKIPHFRRGGDAAVSEKDPQPISAAPHQKPTPQPVAPASTAVKTTKSAGKLVNTFKCDKCNVHAPMLAAMVAHLRNSHKEIPRLFQCPYCRDLEAESEAKIHEHIRQIHPTDNPNPPVALSEPAKRNLRTLSVRLPDNVKSEDATSVERDIYMCLTCNAHLSSLEMTYDHLEQEHTEVFVFVCPFCKVFKSKHEEVVHEHLITVHHQSHEDLNLSLAIDGNQFTRVPCLTKEKGRSQKGHAQKTHQVPTTQSSQAALLAAQKMHQQQLQLQQQQQQQQHQQQLAQKMLQHQQHLRQQQQHQQKLLQQQQKKAPPSAIEQRLMQGNPHPQTLLNPNTLHALSQVRTPVSSNSAAAPKPASAPPSKPAPVLGIKKKKNLLDSIQKLTMQKQKEQQGVTSSKANVSAQNAPSHPSQLPQTTSNAAPPPLIKGPPPLIRYDQLGKVNQYAAAIPSGAPAERPPPPAYPGLHLTSQNMANANMAVAQRLNALNNAKNAAAALSAPPKPIQSSLFDTSDPKSFKPVQRTPVLNVPVVPRSGNKQFQQTKSPPPVMNKPSAPLDLSKTPPVPENMKSPSPNQAASAAMEEFNPEVFKKVFNLKPSTQAQLKQAIPVQMPTGQPVSAQPMPVGQQQIIGLPQPVRPNTSSTLAYRPQVPHVVQTSQIPQIINMPMGAVFGNMVVSMQGLQAVQGVMPAGFIVSGQQPIAAPSTTAMVAVAGASKVTTSTRANENVSQVMVTGIPSQTQKPSVMSMGLPVFKCPYCPKLIRLSMEEVQPHIERQHPGSSIVFMQIGSN